MESEHYEEPRHTVEINFDQVMNKAKLDAQSTIDSTLLEGGRTTLRKKIDVKEGGK
jgi:predicted component of type VI protein secretion system